MTLKEYLEQYNISVAEMAEDLDLPQATIYQWLRGYVKFPRGERAARIRKWSGGKVIFE
jgi:transcriptional regulator with XRE-family HTH domain